MHTVKSFERVQLFQMSISQFIMIIICLLNLSIEGHIMIFYDQILIHNLIVKKPSNFENETVSLILAVGT